VKKDEELQSKTPAESTRHLQMALETAHTVAWEFDVATGKVHYSASEEEISGHPSNAAGNTSDSAKTRVYLDDRVLAAQLFEHAFRGTGPFSSEFRVGKPDGGVIWIQTQGKLVHDAEGRPSRIIGVALDITERKQTDELLRNIAEGVSVATGEAFFRLLAQHLCVALKTDFACIGELHNKNQKTIRTVAVFAGDKFWDELEYELANTPCQEALVFGRSFHPHSVQPLFPADHLLAETGIESYLGVALKGSTGQPLGVMSVMSRTPLTNVSSAETILNIFAARASSELERRQWERALRESESQNRAILSALPDLIFVVDGQGIILDCYAKDSSELSLPHESPVGRKLEAVLAPEAAKIILQSWPPSGPGEPALVEYSVPVPGEIRFYEARTVSFGKDKLLTIIRNITSRKRVEIELDESRRFAQRLSETIPNVLFLYDLIERRNVYTNERSTESIGYTPKEIEDMGDAFLPKLMHPDDFALLPLLAKQYATCQDGEVFEHVFRMRHKNGQWHWVQRCATIFNRTADGRPRQILGSITDITEFKRAERELQELSVRLLSIQDEERRRIARELHDVTGQNLAAIGFNLAALEQSGALPSNVRSILAECQMLCQESQKEIRTLSYVLHPPMLDEFGLVGALDWYIEGFVKRTGIEVTLDVNQEIDRLPSEMETDLFRVVQEGLTNIMRHSGSNTAVIRLEKREAQLILQIKDNGCGMPSRAGLEERALKTGFGVGIPGMRQRVRQHGGSLEVHSEGQGTSLTAVVPIAHHVPSEKTSEKSAGKS
jgi:PAS domain S-box-containing protein